MSTPITDHTAGGGGEVVRTLLASLVAAVSLLERGGKKAAASDKMFEVMLADYRKAIETGRAALAAHPTGPGEAEPVAWAYESADMNGVWRKAVRQSDQLGCYRFGLRNRRPLYEHPPAGGVPAGWKLVPVEPTELMSVAGWIDKEEVYPDDIYRAMLAAAPPPPAGDAGAEPVGEKWRDILLDTKDAADDLASGCVEEGDNTGAGALQFISGFISDRLAALTPAEPAEGR